MAKRASRVPEDSKVALWLKAKDEVRELTAEEAVMVLERDPELLREYIRRRTMTRMHGRLIVIDQRRVAEILTWLDAAA